jgi:hypothetical protein
MRTTAAYLYRARCVFSDRVSLQREEISSADCRHLHFEKVVTRNVENSDGGLTKCRVRWHILLNVVKLHVLATPVCTMCVCVSVCLCHVVCLTNIFWHFNGVFPFVQLLLPYPQEQHQCPCPSFGQLHRHSQHAQQTPCGPRCAQASVFLSRSICGRTDHGVGAAHQQFLRPIRTCLTRWSENIYIYV